MEFQLQSVCLIYTWLMVYTILNLAYPKEHVMNIFYNVSILEPSISFCVACDHVTYDCEM